MATLDEFNKKMTELERKISSLSPNNSGFKQMLDNIKAAEQAGASLNDQYAQAETLLNSVNREIQDINDELGYTFRSFTDIVNEMTKGKNTTNEIKRSTKQLTSIAGDLVNRQKDITNLSVKQLEKLQQKSKEEFQNLKVQQEQLKVKAQAGTLTDKERAFLNEVNGILQENVGLQSSFNRQLESALREQTAIEESLGLTGSILKGLANIPGLGQISGFLKVDEAVASMEAFTKEQINAVKNSDAFKDRFTSINSEIQQYSDAIADINEREEQGLLTAEEADERRIAMQGRLNDAVAERSELEAEATEVATGGLGKMKTLMKGLGSLAGGFGKALTDPMTIILAIAKAAGKANEQFVGIQKSLNLSLKEAKEYKDQLVDAANATGRNSLNSIKVVESQMEYNELLGVTGKLNAENAVTQTELTKQLGISVESAVQLRKFSEATGKNFQQQKLDSYEITSQISSQYGVQINQKQVMEEVGKQSAYTLVQFKGSTTALTEAISKAKALGTDLGKVNQIAGSLLDFESSISKELEAELLTGKQLNLERARYYALTNDISGLMDEINEQMGDFNDFQNMNVIQQQAFAESLGMSVGDLSEMLLMEQYRNNTLEEIAAMEGEDVAKQVEKLRTQEAFQNLMEKLQSTLVDIADGPLGRVMDMFTSILDNSFALNSILGIIGTVQIAKMISGYTQLVPKIMAAAAAEEAGALAAAAKWAVTNPLMALAAVAAVGVAVGGVMSLLSSKKKEPGAQFGGEVMEGGRVMVGEVGPEVLDLPSGARINPLPVNQRNDLRSSQSSPTVDMSPVTQAMREMQAQNQQLAASLKNLQVVMYPAKVTAGQVTTESQIQ